MAHHKHLNSAWAYFSVSIDFVRLVEPERDITLLVVTPQIYARRHIPNKQSLYNIIIVFIVYF